VADKQTQITERLIRMVDGQFEDVDTIVGARIVRWIEDSRLHLHEARVLLALTQVRRPLTGAEIADVTGLDIDSAYQAVHSLHGRGLTEEDSRRHELSDRGRDLMRSFAQARSEGVRGYVEELGSDERRLLEHVLSARERSSSNGG
jgi:DNA-binding MarR family transcriptional regulator